MLRGFSSTFVHHNNSWTNADFPTFCIAHTLLNSVTHEEDDVTVRLSTCLPTPGGRDRIKIFIHLSVFQQNTLTITSAKHKSCLHYFRENQNRFCFFGEFKGGGVAVIQRF